MDQKPTVGRIVHYVLRDGRSEGDHRPAIVTRVWGPECVQLQVFTDGSNDALPGEENANVVWRTSVMADQETKSAGTWHWPERE